MQCISERKYFLVINEMIVCESICAHKKVRAVIQKLLLPIEM